MSPTETLPAAEQEQAQTLMGAILAVQAEAPALQKSKLNPAFRSKYVSLDVLMETVMPIVNKHGLVWITLPGRDEQGDPALSYRLIHAESGDSLDGTMPLMLAKSDPQGQGSAITYARRYSLMAVLGLVADEDDDGNKATPRSQGAQSRPAANGNGTPVTVTQADLAALIAAAKGLKVAQIKLAFSAAGIDTPDPFVIQQAFESVPKAKGAALAQTLAGIERA